MKEAEAWLFSATTVEIRNDLTNGSDLTVHCKAKKDDRGVHVIPPKQTYSFRIKPNMVTLYFCGMSWKGSKLEWFNIYIWERDFICDPVQWSITEKGPCKFQCEGSRQYTECFEWNK